MGNITLHIPKKRKPGTFNQVSNSILYHPKLNGNAVRVFIILISQPNSFNMTLSFLKNKCNIKQVALDTALDQLKEFGYLRINKSKGKNQWHYIVSEYGNLNQKVGTIEDYSKYIEENISKMFRYFTNDEIIEFGRLQIPNDGKIEIIESSIKIKQKAFYKECMSMIKNYRDGTKSHKRAFKGWLSQKIYQDCKTVISENGGKFYPPSKWHQLGMQYRRPQPSNAEDMAQAMSEQSE